MKVTTIINGTTSLILTPENPVETEILKQLNGAQAQLMTNNIKVLQNTVDGGLLISNLERSWDKATDSVNKV